MTNLHLDAHIEISGDFLVLGYKVENRTDRDVYLLNRVNDRTLQTNPDMIYLDLNRDKHIIEAGKEIPALPELSPYMPISPYVTALRAGTDFQETVRISLPVRAFSAYEPIAQGGRTVSYSGLILTLQYYWSVPGMQERTKQIVP